MTTKWRLTTEKSPTVIHKNKKKYNRKSKHNAREISNTIYNNRN